MTDPVDQVARDIANKAVSSLDTHRAEVKGRLDNLDTQIKNLDDSVSETKSFLKWFGGLLVTIMLSVLGWSLVQQMQANESSKTDLQRQVELLQSKEQLNGLRQLAPAMSEPQPVATAASAPAASHP